MKTHRTKTVIDYHPDRGTSVTLTLQPAHDGKALIRVHVTDFGFDGTTQDASALLSLESATELQDMLAVAIERAKQPQNWQSHVRKLHEEAPE